MNEKDIHVKNLSVSFMQDGKSLSVLRHVTLALRAGKITALVGESGSGKSLLGEAIAGLLMPGAEVSGEIWYGGRNLLALSSEEMRQLRLKEISWMAQNPVSALDPMMKTEKQVTEVLAREKALSRKDVKEKGLQQLKKFGLPDGRAASLYPSMLSGGIAQRVLAAMMTITNPAWLIADEPTKGLDAFVRTQAARQFKALKAEGAGILLITHDLKLAERISNYTAILYSGELLEQGRTDDVFSSPLHPYTKGLIDAQPYRKLTPIPGQAPDVRHLPKGCIFQERCPFFEDKCRNEQDTLTGASLHEAKCWRRGGAS